MGAIKLLDCTLRDGGYINDWRFGTEAIPEITRKLEETGVDVLELGFLKNEPYQKDRTVFNSMEQVKALIGRKRPGTQYAVMCEVVNPLPLDMLAPADADSADIIRVIVWKTKHDEKGNVVDALDEGYAYCKGIVEKGYRLCVQPARVDQYTCEEFTAMVRRFAQLSPMAIYVVDSWGTQNAEGLLRYMHLADENMPPEVILGYHGHNNMMQALSVAQAMMREGFERDIMIDASVYGIGRGAGNLNLEIIAKYMNEQCGKSFDIPPMLEVYEAYIKDIYNIEPWGYSESYKLTAKYNCNPAYARYFDWVLHLPIKEIEEILKGLTSDEKVIFKTESAKKIFAKYRRNKWRKKLAIIIPTANRAECIQDYLEKKSREYATFGIDIIIYDSSSDDSTEYITKQYTKREGSTTRYVRYSGKFDGVSLDDKLISAYQQFSKEYEYLWACRDGLLINIWNTNEDLFDILEDKPDVVITYDNWQNIYGFPKLSWYSRCEGILDDHCCHMTILGTNIVSSCFINNVIKEQPIDALLNYGMWQPIAFFHYWAKHSPNVACYITGLYSPNAHGTPSSFWNKKGVALWQWGRRWYEMIHELPPCYDAVKPTVYKVGMADFTPFAPKQLVVLRANGSLTKKNYRENASYLANVTDTKPWRFKAMCLLPRKICQHYLDHPESLFSKMLKAGFHVCKRVYRAVFPKKNIPVPQDNYNLGTKRLIKEGYLSECVLKDNQLCIILPTQDSPDVIESHLYACMDLYNECGVTVIVFDSSKGDDTHSVVRKWQQSYGNALRYDRWGGPFDGHNIDQKVIDAYCKYANQFQYIWIQRDKAGINLNDCISKLLGQMEKQPDMLIMLQSMFDRRANKCEQYKNDEDLFKDCFSCLTELGNVIFKGEFIQKVLAEKDLSIGMISDKVLPEESMSEEMYCLWQPLALFTYIERHKFTAAVYESDCYIYHSTILKTLYWKKVLLQQFVGRMYQLLKMLPEKYKPLFYDVLMDWNIRNPVFSYYVLLDTKISEDLKKEQIDEYREMIPIISYTPLKYFDEIASMSKSKAKKQFEKKDTPQVAAYYSETNHSQLGKI